MYLKCNVKKHQQLLFLYSIYKFFIKGSKHLHNIAMVTLLILHKSTSNYVSLTLAIWPSLSSLHTFSDQFLSGRMLLPSPLSYSRYHFKCPQRAFFPYIYSIRVQDLYTLHHLSSHYTFVFFKVIGKPPAKHPKEERVYFGSQFKVIEPHGRKGTLTKNTKMLVRPNPQSWERER